MMFAKADLVIANSVFAFAGPPFTGYPAFSALIQGRLICLLK